MTVVYPEGVRARGNESVIFVPGVIAVPTAPTIAELTAVGTVNISCWLSGFQPQGNQDSVEDRRLCSEQIFEDPGDVAISIDNLEYVYYPQAATPSATNKAYEVMKRDVTGYVVDRRGLNARTVAIAAAQKVDIYPVRLGEQFRMPLDPGEQGGKFRITQKAFVTGPYEYDAVVAA
jgi:hypothetical protein